MSGDGVTPTPMQVMVMRSLQEGPQTATWFFTTGRVVTSNAARHCLRRIEDHGWVRRLPNNWSWPPTKWELTALGKQVIRHR